MFGVGHGQVLHAVVVVGDEPGQVLALTLPSPDRLPDGIDDKTAAAMMLKGLTVQYLIRQTYRVKSGDTILLHAAAGGVGLISLSYLGIRSGVNAAWPLPGTAAAGASGPARPAPGFVKFFTRHVILGLSAYVMMARFEFDPMAMLAGVTTPAIAAALECARIVRARSNGSHSRLS